MRRFIIPTLPSNATEITLDGDLYRHLITVLRLKPGNSLSLATPAGDACTASVQEIGSGTVTLRLGQRTNIVNHSTLRIELYQGMPKGDKLELIIQKATELGVSRIIPYPAERSITRIPDQRLPERVARWHRIASEAARQSGAAVPEIVTATSLAAALASCDTDLRLLPWENDHTNGLRQLLTTTTAPASVSLVIGPEGGVTDSEVAIAEACGFKTVSLGPRILRTETAGFVLTAILQQAWGDIG